MWGTSRSWDAEPPDDELLNRRAQTHGLDGSALVSGNRGAPARFIRQRIHLQSDFVISPSKDQFALVLACQQSKRLA